MSVTILDNSATSFDFEENLTESIGISDSIEVIISRPENISHSLDVSDGLAISDSLETSVIRNVNIFESLAISDNFMLTVNSDTMFFERLGIIDSIEIEHTKFVAPEPVKEEPVKEKPKETKKSSGGSGRTGVSHSEMVRHSGSDLSREFPQWAKIVKQWHLEGLITKLDYAYFGQWFVNNSYR